MKILYLVDQDININEAREMAEDFGKFMKRYGGIIGVIWTGITFFVT